MRSVERDGEKVWGRRGGDKAGEESRHATNEQQCNDKRGAREDVQSYMDEVSWSSCEDEAVMSHQSMETSKIENVQGEVSQLYQQPWPMTLT